MQIEIKFRKQIAKQSSKRTMESKKFSFSCSVGGRIGWGSATMEIRRHITTDTAASRLKVLTNSVNMKMIKWVDGWVVSE